MSPACVSTEIDVRVERAFTRGTLYPDCRPPTRPTFRPQLRHRAYTYATPATATHPALEFNTCVRETAVFGRRRRRRARAGQSERRIYTRAVRHRRRRFSRGAREPAAKNGRTRGRARGCVSGGETRGESERK